MFNKIKFLMLLFYQRLLLQRRLMLNKILQKRYVAAIAASVLLVNIAFIASGLPLQDSIQNQISVDQAQSPPSKNPPVTYKYPRYKAEMHAGDLADEIKASLGYKLKANFAGDSVDGYVTVGSDEVIIVTPELSQQDKAKLDGIVKNHYSQRAADVLKLHADSAQSRPSTAEPAPNNSASKPLSNAQPNQIVPTGHSGSNVLQSAWGTTFISTTSTAFVDIPNLSVTFSNSVTVDGLYLLSIEANHDTGRVDFRILRDGGNTPIDINLFGQDPTAQFWTRALHGAEVGVPAGTHTVKAQWKSPNGGVAEGFFRLLTVIQV